MVKKITLYKNFKIKSRHRNSIILIGNFDGLHKGHQKLFNLAKRFKKKTLSKIGVLTFEPIPKMFFNKSLKNFRISNKMQKINLLKKIGVDFIIVKSFDKSFSKIKSINFIKNIINKKLNAKFIFVSNNFRFGNKREGDVKQLIEFEKNLNYKIINPKPLKINRELISSTLIREKLREGKIIEVNSFLNRKWSIVGKVQKGKQLGKKFGFPTANINIKDYVEACPGVYVVKTRIQKNRRYIKGIANLGYRPTFNEKELLLEVHLINFSGNLYNKYLTVEFLRFIRKEKKFKNVNELKKQIRRDLLTVKKSK